MCLNLGVDPPDIIKTNPCARLEAWVDPTVTNDPKRAIEQIGKQLQSQYEVLSTRTKYKQSLDPNVEDIKRFCMSLRRNAREERILFHYNGHGVPKPTPSGEIWVFNRGYTQYIPVSIYDLQSWLGAPCIYLFDCHSAGHIINNFKRFIEKRKQDERENGRDPSSLPAEAYENCILMAACRAGEMLPMHPSLPADLFTCCVTSPIEIAIRFFVSQSALKYELQDYTIPGRISDRRTPLGELNWIFTAITDTIAWSSLQSDVFKRLFRQDLVVAAMFRNLLLAQRIMRVYNCHPVTIPELPDTHEHSMWDAWDLAVDHCLVQLPLIQRADKVIGGKPFQYKHSAFFEQQLTAFEYWLKYKSIDLDKPPEQLPVLLQVLLSQIHRLRALVLLSKYLDLGPKAVHLALSIGIFPYVLKLLQSPASELRPVLVYIWARIMAVDYKNIQSELVKENGYAYFINIMIPSPNEGFKITAPNVFEHLAMCEFITSLFCRGHRNGKKLSASIELFRACGNHMMNAESPLLRQWSCLCVSQVWCDYPEAKQMGQNVDMIPVLISLLDDPVPEVRTASLVALTTFLSDAEYKTMAEDAKNSEMEIAVSVLGLTNDASSIVRREVIVFFSKFVKQYIHFMFVCAFSSLEEDIAAIKEPVAVDATRRKSPAHGTIYSTIWRSLLILSEDPYPEVADFGQDVVDYIMLALHRTPLAEEAERLETMLLQSGSKPEKDQQSNSARSLTKTYSSSVNLSNHGKPLIPSTPPLGQASMSQPTSPVATASRSPMNGTNGINGINVINDNARTPNTESVLTSTLKRSVSFAASLKNFALGTPTSPDLNGSLTGSFHGNRNDTSLHMNGRSKSFGPGQMEWSNNDDLDSFAVSTLPYGSGKKPLPVRYQPRDFQKPLELPLSSGFFDWCCEHFQEPQMSHPEADEPGSERYVERVWQRNRNESIIAETQLQKEIAVCGNWNTQVGILNNVAQPSKFLFAQFEPHLIVANSRDGITVWDWNIGIKLNRFCNSNPVGTRITEAKLLNEDDRPLLLTGSSEGVVRLYRNFHSPRDVSLTSAWRVLSDLIPAHRNSGLVAEWQQSRGALLTGGDVRVIRIWDAPREICAMDIPSRSQSPVTSLTSDQVAGDIIVAGFGDGALRVFDRRIEPRKSLVKTWRKHDSWIVKTHMQRGGARELVSGSSDGMVSLWDIRMSEPVLTFQAHKGMMRAIDVHEHAPVISTASQSVAVWSTKGVRVCTVKNPTTYGYLATNKTAQVSALAFHPHRMLMAVNNAYDANISIFKPT